MSSARSKPRHGRKIETTVTDHVPRPITWHVIECKCGWSSPLCTRSEKALRLYEAHRRAAAAPLPVSIEIL